MMQLRQNPGHLPDDTLPVFLLPDEHLGIPIMPGDFTILLFQCNTAGHHRAVLVHFDVFIVDFSLSAGSISGNPFIIAGLSSIS